MRIAVAIFVCLFLFFVMWVVGVSIIIGFAMVAESAGVRSYGLMWAIDNLATAIGPGFGSFVAVYSVATRYRDIGLDVISVGFLSINAVLFFLALAASLIFYSVEDGVGSKVAWLAAHALAVLLGVRLAKALLIEAKSS